MSDQVKELPVLAEAMTVADLFAWERYLKSSLGPRSDVSIYFGDNGLRPYCAVKLEPRGEYKDSANGRVEGDDFPSAIRAAQEWIANRPKVERNAIIRKLALAIIELTDEHGKCTVAMLRGKNFGGDEIALHAEACKRASEMCANSPFSVEGEGL